MMSRMRTALKFMTYGILVGILFTPRSGSETRRELMRWATSTTRGLVGGRGGRMGAQP